MVNIFFRDRTTTGLTIAVIVLLVIAIYFYLCDKKSKSDLKSLAKAVVSGSDFNEPTEQIIARSNTRKSKKNCRIYREQGTLKCKMVCSDGEVTDCNDMGSF